MTDLPVDGAERAAVALRAIVAEYGPEALSSPAMMANLLADLLPGAPRLVRLLVAASEDHIGEMLREHASQGMDPSTAARLVASAFADATLFAPDACAWVVGAFTDALGMPSSADRPPTIVVRQDSTSALTVSGSISETPSHAAARRPAFLSRTATTAYVANYDDGTVTPIDIATEKARAPIKVGPSPMAIAVTPDGATAFVANGGAATVTPVELPGGVRGAPINIEHEARAIAVTPDGTRCYVAGGESVTEIRVPSREAGTPVKIGTDVLGIVISPDGRAAYALDNHEGVERPGAVVAIDIDSGTAGRWIEPSAWRAACDAINTPGGPSDVMDMPAAIAITPDGTTGYVISKTRDLRRKSVTPIDLPTGIAHTPIGVVGPPVAIAISPDGAAAYVGMRPEVPDGPGIVRIDLATGRCSDPISISAPQAIAITPGGETAYVACEDGTVALIDTATNEARASVIVGRGPSAIVIA